MFLGSKKVLLKNSGRIISILLLYLNPRIEYPYNRTEAIIVSKSFTFVVQVSKFPGTRIVKIAVEDYLAFFMNLSAAPIPSAQLLNTMPRYLISLTTCRGVSS